MTEIQHRTLFNGFITVATPDSKLIHEAYLKKTSSTGFQESFEELTNPGLALRLGLVG